MWSLGSLSFYTTPLREYEKLSDNMELHLQVTYKLHVTYSLPKRECVMDLFLEKTPFSLILVSTTVLISAFCVVTYGRFYCILVF